MGVRQAALLIVCVASLRVSANAQTRTRVPDGPQCPKCELRLEPLAELAFPPRAALSGIPMSVLVDAKGRFWVLSFSELPAVFSASGTFISQLGRRGEGPGEFESAGAGFSAPGDSIVIFDQSNNRAS